jgi:hypothetical protein
LTYVELRFSILLSAFCKIIILSGKQKILIFAGNLKLFGVKEYRFIGFNMKYKLLIVFLFFALADGLLVALRTIKRLSNENARLADNQRVLFSDVEYYKTKDSLSVASVERLTLSNKEFEKYCEELTATCQELNLKIKRLQSVSRTATKTQYEIRTVFHDSVVYRFADTGKTITDTMRCVNYNDAYLTFNACEKDGALNTFIESRDTLTTLVYRIPKRFLFFRYGTKAIRQMVVSNNPHSKITYDEYIELKK